MRAVAPEERLRSSRVRPSHAAENRAAASAATDPTANCLRESFFIIPPQLQTTLYCPPPPLSRGLPGASAHRMLFKGELAEEHLLPANL